MGVGGVAAVMVEVGCMTGVDTGMRCEHDDIWCRFGFNDIGAGVSKHITATEFSRP